MSKNNPTKENCRFKTSKKSFFYVKRPSKEIFKRDLHVGKESFKRDL